MYIPKHFTLPPLTKTQAYNSNKYLTNKYLPITLNQVKTDFLNKYEFIPSNQQKAPKREFAYLELKQIGGLNKRYFDRKLTLTKWDNQARSYKTLSNSLQYWALNSSQKLTKISNVSEFSTKVPHQQYLQGGSRGLSNSSNAGRALLGKLESEANQDPNDLNKQLKFYRELLANNYYDLIINRFETYQLACNLEILQIYIKCLVTTNQTGNLANKVVQAIRTKPDLRGYFESADGDTIINNLLGSSHGGGPLTNGANGSSVSLGSIGQNGAQLGASGRKGDKFAPIHVVVEQPKGAALWKTLKSFGLTLTYIFCILTFLSLALDNSGLAKPPSPSPEYEAETSNSVKFDDVQGVDEAKQELVELVEFLKDPAKFTSLGGKLPKGVLLTGPPGTGKTLLARAVAGQAGVPFFFMSGSEFDEMYVGVGARRVRELFAAARRKAPSIVFIDELDAIGARRNPKDQSYMKQTLNQLLVDLDGFSQTEGVIFIAATNFPELLDKALTRPGRFDRHVHVPNPDVRGRLQILKLHSSKIQLDEDVNLERIARGTIGFSGADLANLVNLAAIEAAKKSSRNVTTVHFEYAKDRIIMGAERKSAVITEESKRMTAYHEGGHALVAYFTEGAMPLHKATVIPRGQSLGMVVQLPEMDKNSFSKKEYRARLDVCMGGRVAEELIYGKDNVSSGAQSDLQQATDIARGMIISYGMSDKVGPVEYSNHLNSLSQQTKQLIEDETKRMLTESYERAKQLLITKRPELERLAKALVEKETLNLEEIESVIANN